MFGKKKAGGKNEAPIENTVDGEDKSAQTQKVYPEALTKMKKIDATLIRAWRSFLNYDIAANKEKRRFIRSRHLIILFTMLGSIASIIVTANLPPFGTNLITIQFISLIALFLPLVATAYMQFSVIFNNPTQWVQYRYAAERIRHNIYSYRYQIGIYQNTDKAQLNNKLNDNIKHIKSLIIIHPSLQSKEQNDPDPEKETDYRPYYDEIREALKYSKEDDGFSNPMTFEQYKKTRIDAQKEWYKSKSKGDYSNIKNTTAISLVATTVLGFMGFLFSTEDVRNVALIAMSNSISVGIVAWGNVRMFGKSYGIYGKAHLALENLQGDWGAEKNDPKSSSNLEKKKKFLEKVETVLMSELDEWYSVAIETQLANEQSIVSRIQELQNNIQKESNIHFILNRVKENMSAEELKEFKDMVNNLSLDDEHEKDNPQPLNDEPNNTERTS